MDLYRDIFVYKIKCISVCYVETSSNKIEVFVQLPEYLVSLFSASD